MGMGMGMEKTGKQDAHLKLHANRNRKLHLNNIWEWQLQKNGIQVERIHERKVTIEFPEVLTGIFLHRCTVSKGPKSRVRHSADSDQFESKSVFNGREYAIFLPRLIPSKGF